ncbi:hypothetical protein BDR26DRAFT_803484 [Obelidium mucronatum]|nr:hypothetical protein BDR26DRAFT_803484 [Obelidium mucronatum]
MPNSKLSVFRLNFLSVYLLNFMGDWLQGPYLYALYRSYGYDVGAIGHLFVFGFLSSAILGTVAGSFADKYGRRNMSVVFTVSYTLSCLTKLSPNYFILAIGRILGGISTSLLLSIFEAWMVSEHFSRGFNDTELSGTFAMATFTNGLIAILSGIIANSAVDSWGLVSPFIIAIVFFVIGLVVVMSFWNENYGESADPSDFASLIDAFHVVRNSYVMFATGMIQSLFEASLYIFVFMWPPALEAVSAKDTAVPYGIIFAAFMVSTMLGSVTFRFLTSQKWMAESILTLSLILGAISFALFILFQHNELMLYLAFNLYEVTLGIYFPVMGIVRSQYIPESVRSSIMNLFRMPLNLIVVLVLFKVHSLSYVFVFSVCVGMLAVCVALQLSLGHVEGIAKERHSGYTGVGDESEL